ncbi:MAG: molybdopterin molybdenumtransferase MoeA, partial [Duodenibacillus sp.]
MITYQQALQYFLDDARPVERTETVPTLYAEGRVLAQDVVSGINVPAWDNSQMDGYAVRSAELAAAVQNSPVVLPVSQRIPAGSVGGPLAQGTCARIFTGAPIPPGADAVVQQEDVTVREDGCVQ